MKLSLIVVSLLILIACGGPVDGYKGQLVRSTGLCAELPGKGLYVVTESWRGNPDGVLLVKATGDTTHQIYADRGCVKAVK